MAPVPRYKQIAAILRERIARGEPGPGEMMPGETRVMQEFGVARNTARHAIQLLRDEGLVVVVPGLGTFVRRPGRE